MKTMPGVVTEVKNKIKLKMILLVLFAKYNRHVQNISAYTLTLLLVIEKSFFL